MFQDSEEEEADLQAEEEEEELEEEDDNIDLADYGLISPGLWTSLSHPVHFISFSLKIILKLGNVNAEKYILCIDFDITHFNQRGIVGLRKRYKIVHPCRRPQNNKFKFLLMETGPLVVELILIKGPP